MKGHRHIRAGMQSDTGATDGRFQCVLAQDAGHHSVVRAWRNPMLLQLMAPFAVSAG
jgi:hypothetical protein